MKWTLDFEQYGAEDEQGFPVLDAYYTTGDSRTFKAGRTYAQTFNVGVFGPQIAGFYGIRRDGAHLYGLLPMFADGRGARRGVLLREGQDHPVPRRREVRLGRGRVGRVGSVQGPGGPRHLSSDDVHLPGRRPGQGLVPDRRELDLQVEEDRERQGTAGLTVRFGAPFLGLDSTAPAGRKATVRVTVQGAAAGRDLRSLAVYVSGDGKKWTEVAVKKGSFTYGTPAPGKSVSLRAEVTDKKGNRSTVTIHDAYFGR